MDDTPARRPAVLTAILAEAEAHSFAMSCDDRTGSLLATLATTKPGGRLLELGTGIGAGTAWLREGMHPDARLTTVDADPTVQAVAVRHLGMDERITFECADADSWLSSYRGEPFDLAFVDCMPGKFERLDDLVGLLSVGGLYVGDDLLSHPAWPASHQQRVDEFIARLPEVQNLRTTTVAWSTGLVIGARV